MSEHVPDQAHEKAEDLDQIRRKLKPPERAEADEESIRQTAISLNLDPDDLYREEESVPPGEKSAKASEVSYLWMDDHVEMNSSAPVPSIPLNTQEAVTIPCWPYGDIELASSNQTGVELFVRKRFSLFLWLYLLTFLGFAVYNIFTVAESATVDRVSSQTFRFFFQFVFQAGLAIPFLMARKLRGVSFIKLTPDLIRFEWAISGKVVKEFSIQSALLSRIALVPNEKNPRKSKVRFIYQESRTSHDEKTFDIKLECFGERSRWKQFKKELLRTTPGLDIDERIGELLQPDHKDASYTELWLEALGTAPKSECLEPLSGGSTLQEGKYTIDSQIGKGGQGTAYLSTCSNDTTSSEDKKMVLKEYIQPVYVDMKARRQAIKKFEDEARILGSIDHPCIVKLLDFFVENHRAYLVLEYIEGESLQVAVERNGPMPEGRVVDLAGRMCDILENLHEHEPRVIHQDFTPDNLIISEDDRVKLIDFMVAKKVEQSTTTAQVVGKPPYMPPEQFRGESTPGSDIYAFGATLFFLLTGVQPEPLTQADTRSYNAYVSENLHNIVKRCTALDQDARYQSVAEIKQELGSFSS